MTPPPPPPAAQDITFVQTHVVQLYLTGLWGLVNNAGTVVMGDAELTTIEQYLHVSNVNTFGTVRVTKAFLPFVRATEGN